MQNILSVFRLIMKKNDSKKKEKYITYKHKKIILYNYIHLHLYISTCTSPFVISLYLHIRSRTSQVLHRLLQRLTLIVDWYEDDVLELQ